MISIWTIYDHPLDYPRFFVARRFELDRPTGDLLAARTLEEVREMLPRGLHRMERDPGDDPKIVEVWL